MTPSQREGIRGTHVDRARPASHLLSRLIRNPRLRWSVPASGAIIAYLCLGAALDPHFCDYWPYLALQTGVVAALLVVGEAIVPGERGLSGLTHVMAIACCVLDVAGNQMHLYADIRHYDKVAHFFGIAALTAGMYEVFRGLSERRRLDWSASDRFIVAAGIGFALGVGWEFYEYFGDQVFGTARFGGAQDTSGDLLWDALGAFSLGAMLWWAERRQSIDSPEAVHAVDAPRETSE